MLSSDRILTTHTGSLPRPDDLDRLIFDLDAGHAVDTQVFERRVQEVVSDVVRRQADAGLDFVNDGEVRRISYAAYVKDRLDGFHGPTQLPMLSREFAEFPEVMQPAVESTSFAHMRLPSCNSPISLRDANVVRRDIQLLKIAGRDTGADRLFMTAASPGVISAYFRNDYYSTDEAYLFALADAMKSEYDAIAAAGIVLQLDCPDLAMTRASGSNADLTDDEFRDQARLHVAALNHAVRDIPPSGMRLHVCWGNAERPHIYDIPLASIIDIVLAARPSAISFEAANPRHEHEWQLWRDIDLPDGKLLIPGVLDSTTNFVEHPELVAQRIVRFAEAVGRQSVIAGVDCGFGSLAGHYAVKPRVTWLKLEALVEGARLASERLYR